MEPKKLKRHYHIFFDWEQMKFIGLDYDKDIAKWEKLFPDVDIVQQFNEMAKWLMRNRENGKARKQNWSSFITRWLSRSQQKAVGL
jgi:hypothetical protein